MTRKLSKLKMPSTSNQLLDKFKFVVNNVKQELNNKGIAIPVKNNDGSVSLEKYTIVKSSQGYYVIKNRRGDVVLDRINLPQSAALLANGLALGKWADTELYKLDQEYGYKLFECELLKEHAENSIRKKNIDRAEILYNKLEMLKVGVKSSKGKILSSFEKLRNLH